MSRRRAVLVVMVLVLVLLSVQARRRNPHDLGPVHRTVLTVTRPVEVALLWVSAPFRSAWRLANEVLTARERAEVAERELAQQEKERWNTSWLQKENEALIGLLSMQPLVPGETLGARVTLRSHGSRLRSLQIDRGRSSGLAPGQAVLGGLGYVGQVVEVHRSHATVLALTDRNSFVSARIGPTGIPAMARGDGDRGMVLEGVPDQYREEIERGQMVYCSGDDASAPAGLPLARVSEVSRSTEGLFLNVSAEPVEDTARVATVLVLVEP